MDENPRRLSKPCRRQNIVTVQRSAASNIGPEPPTGAEPAGCDPAGPLQTILQYPLVADNRPKMRCAPAPGERTADATSWSSWRFLPTKKTRSPT